MSIRFKSTQDGDFFVESQDLVLIDEVESFEQGLTEFLRTFYGEWFLNNQYGIPYYDGIIGKFTDISYIQSIFVDQILSYPEVEEIKDLDLDLDVNTRTLSVRLEIMHQSNRTVNINNELNFN